MYIINFSYLKFINNLVYYQVVSRSTSPEWNEGFTWAFDVPPKGQKLQISCKGRTTFGKVTNFIIFGIHDAKFRISNSTPTTVCKKVHCCSCY